jgi:hypothetical protein
MSHELERDLEGSGHGLFEVLSHIIRLEGLGKSIINLIRDIQCPVRDSNRTPPDIQVYTVDSTALPLH